MAGSERAGHPQPLATGTQTSGITWHQQPVPPFALDAANNRLAVADNNTVSVVELTSTSDTPADDLHLATAVGHRRSQDAVRRGHRGVPHPFVRHGHRTCGAPWMRRADPEDLRAASPPSAASEGLPASPRPDVPPLSPVAF